MKLTLDLPDWCDDRHIRVMAGIEMVAYKPFGEDVLYVKKTRCAMCGNCCRNLFPGMPDVKENGTCRHLGARGVDNECGLALDRPYACATGLQQKGRTPGCTIEYEAVKL